MARELKTQNSKLKTLLSITMGLLLLLLGCGKEGPPLPPEIRIAERTTDLTAYQEGDVAVLRWSYPSMTTAGQTLTDVEAIEVWRAILSEGQEPPPPMTAQDRAMQRQLLESQGEVIQVLDPAELAVATRGSTLVYHDDLVQLQANTEDDLDSMVVWYGVRTICCRKRESDLSTVARMLPTQPPEPPDSLHLTAGSHGIEIRWETVRDIGVVVERSGDGAVWTAVTEEPVEGGEWRDEQAAQGRAWSYRLRSVVRIEGGGRVVGKPSAAERIDHPDTYPPETPTDMVCLPEGARVRVRWRLVQGATSYTVTRLWGESSRDVLVSDLKSVEFADPEPPLGEIVYLVEAKDAVGNTSESASCTVVMGAVP